MNLNLVDMVKEQLPGDFINKASSLLGESRDRTQLGIEAAIPGVLGGSPGRRQLGRSDATCVGCR